MLFQPVFWRRREPPPKLQIQSSLNRPQARLFDFQTRPHGRADGDTLDEYALDSGRPGLGHRIGKRLDIFNQRVIRKAGLAYTGMKDSRFLDAEFDRATATVQLLPRKEVSIGMMLTKETIKKIRIVVQDPATDAVLAQSDEIEVGDLI